jgi:hypothetical protein
MGAMRSLSAEMRTCPPGRFSQHLCRSTHAFLKIGHGSIEKSQFPEEVRTPSGFILRRPASWG